MGKKNAILIRVEKTYIQIVEEKKKRQWEEIPNDLALYRLPEKS